MSQPCSIWIVLTSALLISCTPAEDTTHTSFNGIEQTSEPNSPLPILTQDIRITGIPVFVEEASTQIILEARDELTGHISVFRTNALNGMFELDLSNLTLPIHIEAFVDLNRTDRIERCPMPARSNQVISDEAQDLWLGEFRMSRQEDEPYELEIKRSSCGPSASSTSWVGLVELPEQNANSDSSLLAYIKTTHDEQLGTFESVLDISYLTEIAADQRRLSLSHLLPGRHELRVFWDDDSDFQFSPCLDDTIGGGDRGFSELVIFETTQDDNIEAEDAIVVSPIGCSSDLTTVSGRIDIRALDLSDARRSVGRLFLEILDAETTERLYLRGLSRGHSREVRFSLTNLPSTQLIARVFVDRDGDEAFRSCSGSSIGQDLFSSIKRTFDLASNPQQDLGVLQLQLDDCPLEQLSNISIAFAMDSAGTRKESARPVYVVVTNENNNEIATVELTDNHMSLTQPQQLRMTLPPGDYTIFSFVDTEIDAQFTHCEFDAFGDRAATELFGFQLSDYELYTAPIQTITRFGCDFPTVQFNLNVNLPTVPANVSEGQLVINLIESGGLNEVLTFDVPPVAPPWFFPINDLVPGVYTVAVHLDQDGDRRRNHCEDDGVGELEGRYIFELNRASPVLDASIDLVDPCIEP